MIQAGVGLSQHMSSAESAATEAAEGAKLSLEGKVPSIVFAFSSISYDQETVLRTLRHVFPNVPIVGGSAAGEITSWNTIHNAVNVMAIATDQISFASGVGEHVSKDSFKAAAQAAESLQKTNSKRPDLVITLFDGMTGNGADLVEGVKSVFGDTIPLIGGSTGDDYLFEKTYEYYTDAVLSDVAICIGLYGNFSYGFGVRHGWEAAGLPMKVTRADGVLLQEVDGKPALQIYESYFGKDAADLIKEPLARIAYTYPLGITVEDSDELLIRDPVKANEKGEITMAAAIPVGSTIRLMIGDRDRAIAAAKQAAETAKLQLEGHPARAIIMFNCMARNKLLGVRCHEENEFVNSIIGKDIPMIGFYTYGEQGPLLGKKGTPAYFHNETMTLLVLGE